MRYESRLRRLERPNESDLAVILSLSENEHKIICPGHPLDGLHLSTAEMERFKARYAGRIHTIDDYTGQETPEEYKGACE